ncbi:hypothetical protein VTO42DRAFT_8022 [Malbranchea cinnamomea]
MEASEGNNGRDAPNDQQPLLNPPSVEAAYKRKCIELKKRLNEIEAQNDEMRVRNERGRRYIQKMRLESCILLERLAALMGEGSPNQANPELRARAMAIMGQNGTLVDPDTDRNNPNNNKPASGNRRAASQSFLDDSSEGSADEQPPTPQERPLRPKRSRKPEEASASNNGLSDNNTNTEPVSSTLLPILPAIGSHSPAAGYDQSGPVSMSPYTPQGPSRSSAAIAPRGSAGSGLATSPPHHHSSVVNTSPFTPIASASGGHGQPHPSYPPSNPHRYVSAFEDFTNRNRERIISALLDTYGPGTRLTDADIDRALRQEWEAMEPEEKRQYGDRNGGRRNGV